VARRERVFGNRRCSDHAVDCVIDLPDVRHTGRCVRYIGGHHQKLERHHRGHDKGNAPDGLLPGDHVFYRTVRVRIWPIEPGRIARAARRCRPQGTGNARSRYADWYCSADRPDQSVCWLCNRQVGAASANIYSHVDDAWHFAGSYAGRLSCCRILRRPLIVLATQAPTSSRR